MKTLIQRVKDCSVSVDNQIVGKIKNGLLVLLGITHTDTEKDADYLVRKLIHLRIFEDDSGKMNLSLIDKGYSVLVVSQFTLYGNCDKGRRPSFTRAAKPDDAEKLYHYFCDSMKTNGIHTETGIFQAMMDISMTNTGPVTLLLKSKA